MAAKATTRPARSRGGSGASAKRVKAKAKAKTTERTSRAVAKAKAAGATGGNLSRHQRAMRDTAIMARVFEGRGAPAIAEEFDVSVGTVNGVKRSWGEAGKQLDREPMELVTWLADMHFRQFGDLSAMAEATATVNPSVSLGAKKAAGDALMRFTEMMSLVGKLPENLELFRAESVLRRMAEEMMDTMEAVRDGELSGEEAHAFFMRLVESGGQARLDAA